MRERLFQRRLKMLRFLALGCDLHAVVKVLSREFGCSQAGVYKDYERMHRWYKNFLRDDALIIIVRMRLEILSQEAFKMVIDESIKNPYAKISALNAALKITKVSKRTWINQTYTYTNKPKGCADAF